MMFKHIAKNILFLLACVALAILSWGVFHILGNYTFLIFQAGLLALLLSYIKRSRSDKNK
jgi:hypothetical protein